MSIMTFLLVLFGLQTLCLAYAKKSSQKQKSQIDYFLAGKTVTFFPLMMTCMATLIGGGLILGSAEEAYQLGWIVIFYPLGAALGLLLLGAGFGRKLAKLGVSTNAQIFEAIYKSTFLKITASLISITSLFLTLVGQFIASHKFMVSTGVTSEFVFIAFWGFVIFYTVRGGLNGVISTDVIQGIFFIFVLFLCAIWVAFSVPWKLENLFNSQLILENFSTNHSKVMGWMLMPMFFILIGQDMAQRCFSANTPKVLSQAACWSGVGILIVCFIPIFLAILSKQMDLSIGEGESVLMIAIQQATNPYLSSIFGCAILAVIVSTAVSLMNAISSNLILDFDTLLTKRKDLKSAQWATALIAVLAVFFSFSFDNVLNILIVSYELCLSCLFVPIFLAVFGNKGNTLSAGFAMLFGIIGMVLFRSLEIETLRELLNILFSLVGYALGEALSLFQTTSSQPVVINNHTK